MTATLAAVRQGQYELAALRLLLGLLTAMHEAAPAAREELLTLLVTDGAPAPRTPQRRAHREAQR